MTTTNLTLYRLLVRSGASETEAEAAASLDASTLVTKTDLAELKAELFKHTTQTLLWMTAINGALMTTILALFRWGRL